MGTNTIPKYKGYLGSADFDFESGVLHGKILFIQDTVIYEGQTLQELEQNFQQAVDEYLATCAELNRDPQKPFSGTFNVRVSTQLHQQAAHRAVSQGVSLNELVSDAMESFLSEANARVVKHEHVHKLTPVFQAEFRRGQLDQDSSFAAGKLWQLQLPSSQKSH